MRNLSVQFFLIAVTIFMPDIASSIPTKNSVRNGRFFGFTADEMLMDVFDDVENPFHEMSSSGKEVFQQKSAKTANFTSSRANRIRDNTKKSKYPIKKTENERMATFSRNGGNVEASTSADHFALPVKAVTEKTVLVYGGQHFQLARPDDYSQEKNGTDVKIFWNSVGDAVENIPFLPIQINVPDMLSAMTNFFVNYLPFLNRLTNPNHPRLPYQLSAYKNQTEPLEISYYENYDYDPMTEISVNRREFKTGPQPERNLIKLKRKIKRKSNRRKAPVRVSGKKIFPPIKKTTITPLEDPKLLHLLGNDQKDTMKLKNMPITRKRIRLSDREVFNFKNSDISNSPIMIVNVPQRPITHYKVFHQEIREQDQSTDRNAIKTQIQSSVDKIPAKQRRRLHKNDSSKRSSKRKGKVDGEFFKGNLVNATTAP